MLLRNCTGFKSRCLRYLNPREKLRVYLLQINSLGSLEISEYLPPEGAKPRGTVHLVRKGDHFISTVKHLTDAENDRLFSNVPDDMAWRQIREKSAILGFKRDSGRHEQTNSNPVNHVQFRSKKDRRRFLQATVFSQASIALESLDDQPNQDVYTAFVKSLEVLHPWKDAQLP